MTFISHILLFPFEPPFLLMLAQASGNTSGGGGGDGDVLMREKEKYVENPPVPYHRLAVGLTISAENFNLKQEDAIHHYNQTWRRLLFYFCFVFCWWWWGVKCSFPTLMKRVNLPFDRYLLPSDADC
jgi:hypothetical protein